MVDEITQPRKRGRPKGCKDKVPRKRRRAATYPEIRGPVMRDPIPAMCEPAPPQRKPDFPDLPSRQSMPPLPPIRVSRMGHIVPTDEHRRFVFDMAFIGVPAIQIARLIGISESRLHNIFRRELDGAGAYRMQEISQALQDLLAVRNPATVSKLLDTIHKAREAERDGAYVEPRLEIVDVTPAHVE